MYRSTIIDFAVLSMNIDASKKFSKYSKIRFFGIVITTNFFNEGLINTTAVFFSFSQQLEEPVYG